MRSARVQAPDVGGTKWRGHGDRWCACNGAFGRGSTVYGHHRSSIIETRYHGDRLGRTA
ncbi:hypothetical protein C8Q78DRAFT_1062008 [Trametes maxima]|nr:hypothetical protein C8Q78DRAFT_1062008 [Trametes maxima]